MSGVAVRRQLGGSAPYVVIGADDEPVADANAFLAWLVARGRSSYTVRSYALGVADLLRWLQDRATSEVDRTVLTTYIGEFRSGAKSGAAELQEERAGRLHPVTRKPAPAVERQPRTVNHRLSVLASYFAFLIERDTALGEGSWCARDNPVPASHGGGEGAHGSPGRDPVRRGRRGELRQRPAHQLPRGVDPALAERLIAEARSWRDKALLTLLWRTGQRVGDWHEVHGCHGLLGRRLADVDEQGETVLVRLKGARDEHRVPVTEDFWPLWRRYLVEERCWAEIPAAWVGLRRGRGRPLTYAAFESSLRYLGDKLDVNVNAHMFRHALAQAVVQTSGLKVAQELLGHRHITTTADTYAQVDAAAMIEAVVRARAFAQLDTSPGARRAADTFAFAYDDVTLAELGALASDDGAPDEAR